MLAWVHDLSQQHVGVR